MSDNKLILNYQNGILSFIRDTVVYNTPDIELKIGSIDAEAVVREMCFGMRDFYPREMIVEDYYIRCGSYVYDNKDVLFVEVKTGDSDVQVDYNATACGESFEEYLLNFVNSMAAKRSEAAYRNDNFLRFDYKDGLLFNHVSSEHRCDVKDCSSSDIYLEVSPESCLRVIDEIRAMFTYGKMSSSMYFENDYKITMAISTHKDGNNIEFSILRVNLCKVDGNNIYSEFAQFDYSGYADGSDWKSGLDLAVKDISYKIRKS